MAHNGWASQPRWRCKGVWSATLQSFDLVMYSITHSWRDSYFAIDRAVASPDIFLDHWIHAQLAEYSFVGLVGSVVTATVAQMLQHRRLEYSPWTASAALFLSLVLAGMAVVTALYNAKFLGSAAFHSSRDAKVARIFGTSTADSVAARWRRVWLGTLVYSVPELLLAYSVICALVGIGVLAVSPLWSCEGNDCESLRKIASVSCVGIAIGTAAFFASIVSRYFRIPAPTANDPEPSPGYNLRPLGAI